MSDVVLHLIVDTNCIISTCRYEHTRRLISITSAVLPHAYRSVRALHDDVFKRIKRNPKQMALSRVYIININMGYPSKSTDSSISETAADKIISELDSAAHVTY